MIVHEGPSLYDGNPIVVVVTGVVSPSQNLGTGVMAQAYILRSDCAPYGAQLTGHDVSVCGTCARRPSPHGDGSCYVSMLRGPGGVYHALPIYPRVTAGYVAGILRALRRPVRIGAYGDPAFVPIAVWDELTFGVRHTGYTHAWQDPRVQPYRRLLMASVDTVRQRATARALGWRTFRPRAPGAKVLPGEIECLKSHALPVTERRQCVTCGLCDGIGVEGRRRNVKDIAIWEH